MMPVSATVLHIGLAKTGTTTIQATLAANAAALAARGIVYPRLGPMRWAQHALAQEVREGEGTDGPAWAGLRAVRAGRPDATVAVSSEALAPLDPRVVRAGLGPGPARVLAYLRDPRAWIVSAYATRALTGRTTLGFDDFLDRSGARLAAFADRILPWAAAFGPEAVRIRSVHPADLEGGALVTDALAALGTTPEGLEAVADRNATPDWRVVELVRDHHARRGAATAARGTGPEEARRFVEASRAAAARLGWSARGDYLRADQRARLAERFARDRERLLAAVPDARIHPGEEDQGRDRPFAPSPEAVEPEDRKRFLALFAEALAARGSDP